MIPTCNSAACIVVTVVYKTAVVIMRLVAMSLCRVLDRGAKCGETTPLAKGKAQVTQGQTMATVFDSFRWRDADHCLHF